MVEDDRDHRAVIHLTLQLAGYDVRDTATAEDALAVVHRWLPHALVLDVRLPGMSGLELLTVIRSSPEQARLAVILCSAHAESSAANAARVDPWTDFVAKPYHPDLLLTALSGVLGGAPVRSQPAAQS
ncbi:MAG TPA: response regulator [Acidimicrobiia bacterium]